MMNEIKRKRRVVLKRTLIVTVLFSIFALVGFNAYAASPKTVEEKGLVKKGDYSFVEFLDSEVFIQEEGTYTFEFEPKDNENENGFQVEIRSENVTEGETFTFHKKETSSQTLHLKKGTYILKFTKQPEEHDTVGEYKIKKEI